MDLPTKIIEIVRTEAEWLTDNPVIPLDMQVFTRGTGYYKIGDDVSVWSGLPHISGPAGANGMDGIDGAEGPAGPTGNDGQSAYQIAVNNGFIGTEADWLGSLQGETGPQGPPADTTNLAAKDLALNTQNGNYTLALADRGNMVRMNVASANTLTVPPNSSVAFPVGTQIVLSQAGLGQTQIVAGSGVTVNSSGAKMKLTGQYSAASLIQVSANVWLLAGDLSA